VITPTRTAIARVSIVAACLSLVAALAGCSSPAASSPGTTATPGARNTRIPAASTSCTVVSQSDVSTALGETVQAPVMGKATVEGGIACVYYGQSVKIGDPDVPSTDSVRVVLVTGADGTKWFNDYKTKVPAVAISGLGDQAYYDGSASVSVLKGTSYLRISVIRTTGPNEAAEETLASTAIPNM
jgi:hypothetical protein